MMSIRLLALLVGFTTCRLLAGDVVDSDTGITFPASLSRWYFSKHTKYPQPEAGNSYSYKSRLSPDGAVTCYIYTGGYSEVPEGGSSELIRGHLSSVAQSIAPAWRQHGGVAEELVPITPYVDQAGKVLGLYCAHRITVRKVTNISVTAVTGYRGRILKLRFTFPGNDLARALTDLGGCAEFLRELQLANAGRLSGLFSPATKQSSD